ncbi:unnamed protein product [Boreogadus saida]
MKTRPAGIGSARADWMGSLSPKLTAMPLKYLAVPGSHDSFTFWVDVKAPVGPDQKAFVKYLATIFRHMAKKVMVKWSMTQRPDTVITLLKRRAHQCRVITQLNCSVTQRRVAGEMTAFSLPLTDPNHLTPTPPPPPPSTVSPWPSP